MQLEVFVLRLRHEALQLAGPCGPAPWYLEVGPEDDPVDVVTCASRNLISEPLLVHSTSWRRARSSVILSFVVVMDGRDTAHLQGVPVARAELARSGATSAPIHIDDRQVIEHGLRHLAWLVQDDEEARRALSVEWQKLLSDYVPEPFRALGSTGRPVSGALSKGAARPTRTILECDQSATNDAQQ